MLGVVNYYIKNKLKNVQGSYPNFVGRFGCIILGH
jgi:hypothetical protein